jgi:transcriptional regulator with XRE-family HTH domain
MRVSEELRGRRLRLNKKTDCLLRDLRQSRGWTQAEIAEFTGYSRVYINKLELGQVPNPSITLIRKLARLFNVPMEKLCM